MIAEEPVGQIDKPEESAAAVSACARTRLPLLATPWSLTRVKRFESSDGSKV